MTYLNPRIFREYDIRGLVGEDLTQSTVTRIGLAYGTFLRRRGSDQAVVARDCRLSSYAYSQVMTDALLSTGVRVLDIGMAPTPVLYFMRVNRGIEGGVMVTGSHNPPEFNGFKLAGGPDTLHGDEIQEIRRIAEEGEFAQGEGSVEVFDPLQPYVDDIAGRVSLGPNEVRVVVDAGNGSSGPCCRAVLEKLGASYDEMFFEPDGTFPNHHPDPTRAKNLKVLAQRVVETGADLGVAFDGDADRIGVVDSSGTPVWGDRLQIVFWREILKKHPGALALIEVKCSQSLVEEVVRLGGRPEFTKTGHSLIKARMRETDALFTGEMSGHMFFRDEHYGYDDAIYAMARLLRLMSNGNKSLAALLEDVPEYPSTPEVRVDCPDDDKFQIVSEVSSAMKDVYQVISVDGARVLFQDGWGLVRASNTQPALVLRAEAKTETELSRIKGILEDLLGGFPCVGAIQWD